MRFTGEVVANNGKRVEVQMEFLTSKQAHPVAFRMLEKKGRWVVYDVLIEGISMIKNYRDQFRDILSNGDPQTLIERVQAKAIEQKEKKNEKDGEKKSGGFDVDLKADGGLMQMMGGFTVLRLTSMMGMMNISFTKEELLKMNKKLNKIKKPKEVK